MRTYFLSMSKTKLIDCRGNWNSFKGNSSQYWKSKLLIFGLSSQTTKSWLELPRSRIFKTRFIHLGHFFSILLYCIWFQYHKVHPYLSILPPWVHSWESFVHISHHSSYILLLQNTFLCFLVLFLLKHPKFVPCPPFLPLFTVNVSFSLWQLPTSSSVIKLWSRNSSLLNPDILTGVWNCY